MKIRVLIPIIIIGVVVAFTYHFIALAAIDAPHNEESNDVGCGSCHGEGLLYSPFWGYDYTPAHSDDTPYNKICFSCHQYSSGDYTGNIAPLVQTHSDRSINGPGNEAWTRECIVCHDPHYQKQKNYKRDYAGELYLARGEFTDCEDNGDGTSTLTFTDITYKSGWDAAGLTEKTSENRRAILFPDVGRLGYSYEIKEVNDPPMSTIIVFDKTLSSNVCDYLYLPTMYAVMYGQYIRDAIDVSPDMSGTLSTVKFFDKTGQQNSFAFNENAPGIDPTPYGVCQVCHTDEVNPTNPTHWRADGTGADHYNDYEGGCRNCHSHMNGFAHGGGGDTECADCHGTTGSHPAHDVGTIGCDPCHNGDPPNVSPGTGYSFTYDDNTNTCFNIRSDTLGSCHFETDAIWDESACTGCHGSPHNMGARVNVMAQFSGNSHHIQGTTVEGAHCYQCHWEADIDGLITSYHENSPSGSPVDLVVYGNGSRPSNYDFTTAIQYTADGTRAEINKLNNHCISCHSDQNKTTEPFGDGKTPKQYAWDETSIEERYSQIGTAPWGKYGGPIINESFERSPGYDETWTETVVGCSIDPDYAVPGIPPPGVGSQSLQASSATGCLGFATLDYGSEQPQTFTSFYVYVDDEGLTNGDNKKIGSFLDSGDRNVFVLRLQKRSGQLEFALRVYNFDTLNNYSSNISLNTWYKIELKYDDTTNYWQWRINGELKGGTNLAGVHRTGIQKWNLGFMNSDQTAPATVYFDLVKVNWGDWEGQNVTPKKKQTKAYSAHGNAISNEGGWDLNETWPNTRNGSEDILCFDCHNSHGSNVSGSTTSYISATTNGGILKDIEAGKGGYSMTYKPQAGGSIEDKNAYNAGAGICFDCHLTSNGGSSKPWGYQSTFGATQAIMGYRDTPYFGPSVSSPQQRFTYKSTNPHQGGHLGASSDLSGLPGNPPPDKITINGLCTPCHDPHGVSTTLNQEYAVPLLKGTWLTSPYKEDIAPWNNIVGTARVDKGREGIPYYIDQNTFNSVIWDIVPPEQGIQQSDTQFAGLCLRCHTKNSMTDGTNGGTWKSVDRIHESVKDWGENVEHNYPCSKCHTPHNSRLPRLMVTNCLDNKHKGHVGNNPSPVISGSGQGSKNGGMWPAVNCSGLSTEFGGCGTCRPIPYPYSGSGGGNFPGEWGGTCVIPYNGHYGGAAPCHKNNASDQSWNSKTLWP